MQQPIKQVTVTPPPKRRQFAAIIRHGEEEDYINTMSTNSSNREYPN